MTKQRSQFGCRYLQTVQEVTGSLILNSNHIKTSFRDICAVGVSVMHV